MIRIDLKNKQLEELAKEIFTKYQSICTASREGKNSPHPELEIHRVRDKLPDNLLLFVTYQDRKYVAYQCRIREEESGAYKQVALPHP